MDFVIPYFFIFPYLMFNKNKSIMISPHLSKSKCNSYMKALILAVSKNIANFC